MKTFNGKLVVTVQSIEETCKIELKVNGKGLKSGTIEIHSKEL